MTDMSVTAEPATAPMPAAPAASARPKKKLARYVLAGSLAAVVAIAAAAGAAHLNWIYSGSGAWELLEETNGTTLYALKAPGTSLVKYRSVARFDVPIHRMVHFMQDVDACEDLRCRDAKVIEWVNPKIQLVTFTYGGGRYGSPFTFAPREFVVKIETTRDPLSDGVLVRYVSEPNLTAHKECCVRVPHMNNSWRFTPLENGAVEVEYTIDMYEGGFLPSYYANRAHRATALRAPTRLPQLLMTEKYARKYADKTIAFLD